MTFQELDACIAVSGRRSIASALIAFILDALDDGQDGVDLDIFQSHTRFVRNNVTTVASYLQLHGGLSIYCITVMVLQNVNMSPLIITGGGQSSTIVLLRL